MRGKLHSTPLLALLACLLWSSAFTFIKIGLPYSAPFQFAGMRFFLAGWLVLLGWFLQGEGRWGLVRTSLREYGGRLVLLSLLQIGIKYLFFYWGMALVPASLAAMIGGMGPLMAVVVTACLPPFERLPRRAIGALLLGVLGVIVLTLGRKSMGAVGAWALLGIGFLLINTITSGLGDWFLARYGKGVPAPLLSSTTMVWGGAMLLVTGWGIEGVIVPPLKWAYWGSLLALSLISSGAVTLWFYLLKRPGVRVGALNLWKFTIPFFGALIAWLFLPDEHPTWVALLGMVLIGSAVWLLPRNEQEKGCSVGATDKDEGV